MNRLKFGTNDPTYRAYTRMFAQDEQLHDHFQIYTVNKQYTCICTASSKDTFISIKQKQ